MDDKSSISAVFCFYMVKESLIHLIHNLSIMAQSHSMRSIIK